MTWHLKDVIVGEKLPYRSWAMRLDPIKTRKTYVNSEKKILNSQFCNPL